MPNPAALRERRLRKTKVQLIDEIDTLEQHAAEKEAQLRVALDNMPGGMLLWDRDLNFVLFNSRYSELFEYPDGLVKVGGSSRDVWRYQADRGDYGPGDKDELIERVLTTFQRGEQPRGGSGRVRSDRGATRPCGFCLQLGEPVGGTDMAPTVG